MHRIGAAFAGQAELRLNPVPCFVREQDAALGDVVRKRREQHRPTFAGPIDSGIGDRHIWGKRTDPAGAVIVEDAGIVAFAGPGPARCGLHNKERPAAEIDAPRARRDRARRSLGVRDKRQRQPSCPVRRMAARNW